MKLFSICLRQRISIVVILFLLFYSLSSAMMSFAEQSEYPDKGQYNIELPEGRTDYVIMSSNNVKNGEVIVEGDDRYVYVSQKANSALSYDTIVEKNITFTADTVDPDKEWVTQEAADLIRENYDADWNYDMINVKRADISELEDVDEGLVSEDAIKVAILDSGVDYVATDAKVVKCVNLIEHDQEVEDMLSDTTGHGSAVAGIINNIDPDAAIYSVRVLDENNTTTLSRVVEGIYWCIENEVDIINMSFGTEINSEILHQAILDAKEHGILMIASSGNDPETEVEYPARYSEVMAVGSADPEGKLSVNNAEGEATEILAPGELVFAQSTLGLYTIVNGTSVAAPHVAGVASLLLRRDCDKSPEFIRGLMIASSRKTEQNSNAGILDAEQANESYDEYQEDPEQFDAGVHKEGVDKDGEAHANWGTWPLDVPYDQRINLHEQLVDLGIELEGLELSGAEVGALKAGAVYPDKADLEKTVPYHGRKTKNWFTTHKYITVMAQAFRNHSGGGSINYPNSVTLLGTNHYSTNMAAVIKHDFKRTQVYNYKQNNAYNNNVSSTIRYYSWSEPFIITDSDGNTSTKHYLLSEGTIGEDLDLLSATEQLYLKSLFIYGVAIHNMTDTFAHASYGKIGNSDVIPIVHSVVDYTHILGADDKTVRPKRWIDAKYATQRVIVRAINGTAGVIKDFQPHVTDASRDYWLHAPIDKANVINPNSTYSVFNYINCKHYSLANDN